MVSVLVKKPVVAVQFSPAVALKAASGCLLKVSVPKQPLGRLLKRAEFLATASKGRKWVAPGMIVQFMPSSDESQQDIRYGLTASRKVGGAVVRNRARRRLRAIAEEILPQSDLPPSNVVIIARFNTTVSRDFVDLKADLRWCLRKLATQKAEA